MNEPNFDKRTMLYRSKNSQAEKMGSALIFLAK